MSQVALRVSVLLSMQRALWDEVTPGLRGVAVAVSESAVSGRMIFDHVPTDDDVENCSLIETHIICRHAARGHRHPDHRWRRTTRTAG